MNELDELVYALEDLDLSEQNLKVFMNKGEIGGPQGKIEEGDGFKAIKEEWQEEPEKDDKNFANKAKKKNDYIK